MEHNHALSFQVFAVTWSASPTADETCFVSLKPFIGRMIRLLPQTNAEGSFEMGLRFELHGYTVNGDPLPMCK